MDIRIRKASLTDVDFLIEAIIEAEKSGTDILSFSTIFNLTEEEVKRMLCNVLEKEEPGCELTPDNFLIAEDITASPIPLACVCGWMECDNEEELPSQTIKANLLSSQLAVKSLMALRRNSVYLKDLQVHRPKGSYQLEYVYCRPEYRKRGIVQTLLREHENKARILNCSEMYILLCAHNQRAIESYRRFGFLDFQTVNSQAPEIKCLLPDDTKLLMKKIIA